MKNATKAPRAPRPKTITLRGITTIESGMLCVRYPLAQLDRILASQNMGKTNNANTARPVAARRGRPAKARTANASA
jgi:hypothetical protein